MDQISNTTTGQCVSCEDNAFVVKEENACRNCPRIGPSTEATCSRGKLIMRSGFFSSAVARNGTPMLPGGHTSVDGTTIFAKCPCEECCHVSNSYTGEVECRRGTTGTLCAVCKNGFHRQIGGACVACPQSSFTEFMRAEALQLVTLALLAVLALTLVAMDARSEWHYLRSVQRHVQGLREQFASKTKILVNFGQFVTLAGPVYAIEWPPLFKRFLGRIAFFNLDPFSFVPFDCFMPSWSFHSSLLVSTLSFVGLATVAAVAKGMARSKAACLARKADMLVSVALFVAYAVYPGLSAKVFATFNCGTVVHAGGSTTYLRADHSIACDEPEHEAFEAYAVVMVALISVGTPALYFALLWWSHDAVQSGARSARHLRWLVQDYRPDCWYWESVETARKLVLTGVAVFVAQGTVLQLLLGLAFCVSFFALVIRVQPYRTAQNNRFAHLCNAFMVVFIVCNVLLQVDKTTTQLEGATNDHGLAMRLLGFDTGSLDVLLIVIVVASFAAWAWFVYSDVTNAHQARVARLSDGSLVWLKQSGHPLGRNLFLSHSQQDGGDQVAHIKKELEQLVETIEIFTDVAAGRKETSLDAKGSLDVIIENSDALLCFVTTSYFTRKWCVLELKMALDAGKAVFFVYDTDPRHGGMSVKEVLEYATTQDARAQEDKAAHISNLVSNYSGAVSAAQQAASSARQASATTDGEWLHMWLQETLPGLLDSRPVIPWFRDAHCKVVSLKRILQVTLAASFDAERFDSALPALHIPGETSRRRVHLPPCAPREDHGMTHHLFLSPHHPASAVLQQKLEERLPGIVCSTEDVEACSMMLVVLDAGASGNAEASSPALINDDYRGDILHALSSGVGIVSLLVGATRLEAYASQSKRGVPLWKAGLYDTIAIPAPASLLRPGDAPMLAREDPELEATALGRVGLRLRANAPSSRESGRLRSGLLRASTALGGIIAGCKTATERLFRTSADAMPVTTAERFQVTNPMFDGNAMHGKGLPSASKAL